MTARTQKICAWCGPAMIAFWAVGFLALAGFVPPPSPSATSHEIARLIREHTAAIRWGLIFTVVGSALLAPYIGVIGVYMKRIEGRESPLTYAQLVLGACLILEFIFPMAVLQAATFRPERADEAIMLLSDVSWVPFFGIASTVVLEAVVFGIAILQDQRDQPLFPRWSGYYCIYSGLLFGPGTFLVFFKTGPMAWDGLLVFWVPVVSFSIWVVIMTLLMIRATNRPDLVGGESGENSALARRVDALTSELAHVKARFDEISAGPE